jgi:hypothetical protein
MIDREVFDWGVQLTTRPFADVEKLSTLTIRSEVSLPNDKRGTVKITFSGVSGSHPLKLVEAQAWATALNAIIMESQRVLTEMKSGDAKSKRRK